MKSILKKNIKYEEYKYETYRKYRDKYLTEVQERFEPKDLLESKAVSAMNNLEIVIRNFDRCNDNRGEAKKYEKKIDYYFWEVKNRFEVNYKYNDTEDKKKQAEDSVGRLEKCIKKVNIGLKNIFLLDEGKQNEKKMKNVTFSEPLSKIVFFEPSSEQKIFVIEEREMNKVTWKK